MLFFCNPILQNVTISDNNAATRSGGLTLFGANPVIINTIISQNSPDSIELFITENEDYNSNPTITYSNIQGDTTWAGNGNINLDPLFTDPDNGDFTLQPSSPCIDAGDPDSPLDPDGTIADMGAYYYHQEGDPPDPDEVEQVVLVEMFTNDGCTPCVPVNHLLDELFEDYNENITMIRYHWNSPSPTDPMYNYNPADVELRRQMYSILFCPVAVVNGIHILPGQQNIESDSEVNILSELANESILYLGHEVSLDNDSIVVDLEILPFEIIDGPVKSWAVVVEDS
ncbi:uncharacterized protein METZ01_LOCUS367263, partial [marine metagenome]